MVSNSTSQGPGRHFLNVHICCTAAMIMNQLSISSITGPNYFFAGCVPLEFCCRTFELAKPKSQVLDQSSLFPGGTLPTSSLGEHGMHFYWFSLIFSFFHVFFVY
jgi:hypothetical protein